jgi:long-chain acyl-CoA synthetase
MSTPPAKGRSSHRPHKLPFEPDNPAEEEIMGVLKTRQVAKPFEYKPRPAFDMLDETVRRFGDRPAIDFLGKHWNWAEIGDLADRAAAGLQRIGVAKGVMVGLCLPNTPYFVIMYYAILKAGGTVVNFNPLYTEREIESQAKDAEVSIMVSIDLAMIQTKIAHLAAKGLFRHVVVCSMTAALPWTKGVLFRLFKGDELLKAPNEAPFIRFETLIARREKPSPVQIDPHHDIATLQFTGGTTGVPKAAMLSHANITANVQQILASGPPLIDGQERIMGILPFFHVYAMTAVMNLGTANGAELILIPRMDLKLLMATIFRCRPTVLPAVPTLYAAITNAAGAGVDLSFIKHCTSGGAPIAVETADRFERASKCQIVEGYGLSETSPAVTVTPPGGVRRGSVGTALPGTVVEIRDPEHPETVLPQGERGEICIRGPQVMLGYYNHPEETAKVFVDGALRTGDIGYLDADGYLFIVDRIKDLILCGGYNVYPRVIEEAAYLHPDVQDAIAIGIPDVYRGQSPKLFVILRSGADVTPEAIKAFLIEHLNKIEIPKEIEIRDSLPKTMVGKLSKKELVAEEAAKAAAEPAA